MRKLLALTLGLLLLIGGPASAGFIGPFGPANWTLTNTNADGLVDTSGAPERIVLTGGNNGSGDPGLATFTTSFAAAATVTFSWSYETTDLSALYDPAGYVLNGAVFRLTSDLLSAQSGGPVIVEVAAGDSFGWYVATIDNLFGRGSLTVTEFTVGAIAVPAPGALAVFGVGLLGLAALRRRKA